VGIPIENLPALVTLFGQRFQLGHDGLEQLHNNGCSDIRVDAHGHYAELGERATAEEVQKAEQNILISRTENLIQHIPVDTGQGDMGCQSIGNQNPQSCQ